MPVAKKAKTAPEKPPSVKPLTKPVPRILARPPRIWAHSASVEDVPEDIVHSVLPLNPQNILEAADGSDDMSTMPGKSLLSESAMSVDDDVEMESEVKEIEAPEKSDEAELGVFYSFGSILNSNS